MTYTERKNAIREEANTTIKAKIDKVVAYIVKEIVNDYLDNNGEYQSCKIIKVFKRLGSYKAEHIGSLNGSLDLINLDELGTDSLLTIADEISI